MNKIKLLTLCAACAVSGGLMMAQTGTSPATQPDRTTQKSQAQKSDNEKKHKNTAMSQDSQSQQRSAYGSETGTSSGMASSQSQDHQRSSSGYSSSQSQPSSSTGMAATQSQQRSSMGMSSQQQGTNTDPYTQRSASSSRSQSSFGMSSSLEGVAKVEAEQKDQILASSDLVGADIKDQNDNTVGTISDLHLSQDGRIEAVHVDIGGVLGIGSTTYRIPFDGLDVSRDGEEVQVQIQQQTLQELAGLSPELQDEMEGWDTTDQQATASTQTRTPGQAMRQMGAEAEQTTRSAAGAVGAQMSETGRQLQEFGQTAQDSSQFVDRIRNELDSDSPALQDITNVQVQMQQDRLILQGQVQNEQSKQDIVDAAESVAEGREVVDNLRVDRSGAVGATF